MSSLPDSSHHSEGFTADLSRVFTVGKVIPVRIIAADVETGRIVASARQALDTFNKPSDTATVDIGTVTSGDIAALHEANIVITLQPSRTKALMSYSTLARHRKTTIDALRANLAKGQTLEDLVVVSKNADKGFVIVGLVPSKAKKVDDAEQPASNVTLDSLVVGQVVAGRICGKVPTGILVQLSRTVRGRVQRTEVADDYDVSDAIAMGSHVQCVVLEVDAEHSRVDLSLRPSRLDKDVVAKDIAVSAVEELKSGQQIRGFVKNIANHGLFVSLGGNITARVLIKVRYSGATVEEGELTSCSHRNSSTSSSRSGSLASLSLSSSRARSLRALLPLLL